jgi:hypothetical protein
VIGAFLLLTRATIRNRLLQQVRRLRSPRYALALLLGVGYFWLLLLRPSVQPGRAPTLVWSSAETIAALGVLFLMLGPWVFKGHRMALAFTPAEVQFLFPAPVTRRGLILYKLFRTQLVIFFNALIWVFLLRRSGSVLAAPLRHVGTWLVFTNLSLHRLGASLVRTSLAEHGRAALQRHLPSIVIGGCAVVAMGLMTRDLVPAFQGATEPGDFARAIELATNTPAARALFLVPRIVVGPSFAQTAGEWLRAVWPAMLLLGLQALWVLRSDVAFEEAAVQASAERARVLDAWRRRAGGKPRPRGRSAKRTLPLGPTGLAEVGIVWKNLLLLMRTLRIAPFLGLAFMAVALSLPAIDSGGMGRRFLAVAALAMAGLLLVLGSRVLQNDLRQDTEHLATLKTLPLRGGRLVAAEVISAALPIAALQTALVTLAYVGLLNDSSFPVHSSTRGVLLALAPLVLVALEVTTVTIQNGAALLFPGWIRPTPLVGGGIEAMGQGILATGMLLLTFVVALLPAALTFVSWLWLLPRGLPHSWVSALIAAAVVLLLEAWWAIRALGRRFERMEPNA